MSRETEAAVRNAFKRLRVRATRGADIYLNHINQAEQDIQHIVANIVGENKAVEKMKTDALKHIKAGTRVAPGVVLGESLKPEPQVTPNMPPRNGAF